MSPSTGKGKAKLASAGGRRTKVFKLKKRQRPTGNSTENSTEGTPHNEGAGGTAAATSAIAGQESMLASMEQQLRAGIRPTLPSSKADRESLARSLPPAPPMTRASKSVIRVVDMSLQPKRRAYNRKKKPANSATSKQWVVATDWPFEEKLLKGMSFVREIWMMMNAFGDSRGETTCKCTSRGKEMCPCLETLAKMESLVRSFGLHLVDVCREWSAPKPFKMKHVRMAMPGEMRGFMAWRDAHSKRGTKNSEEKGAGIKLGDEDVDDDDDDVDADDVSSTGDGEGMKGSDPLGDDVFGLVEEKDLVAEEEEVAKRMLHRKRFADDLTADMEGDDYVKMYFENRKAFFLANRGSRKPSQPGSSVYFVNFLKLSRTREAANRKMLEALAYMLYDYVGLVVEIAIRRRNGGPLVALPQGAMLTVEEVRAAASRVPRLPNREQRERVRAVRIAHPDGLSKKPLQAFCAGLEHRGDPLKWPCNTIEKGQVLVEGGELVDASDSKLAEEAMKMLETDFADFDS